MGSARFEINMKECLNREKNVFHFCDKDSIEEG